MEIRWHRRRFSGCSAACPSRPGWPGSTTDPRGACPARPRASGIVPLRRGVSVAVGSACPEDARTRRERVQLTSTASTAPRAWGAAWQRLTPNTNVRPFAENRCVLHGRRRAGAALDRRGRPDRRGPLAPSRRPSTVTPISTVAGVADTVQKRHVHLDGDFYDRRHDQRQRRGGGRERGPALPGDSAREGLACPPPTLQRRSAAPRARRSAPPLTARTRPPTTAQARVGVVRHGVDHGQRECSRCRDHRHDQRRSLRGRDPGRPGLDGRPFPCCLTREARGAGGPGAGQAVQLAPSSPPAPSGSGSRSPPRSPACGRTGSAAPGGGTPSTPLAVVGALRRVQAPQQAGGHGADRCEDAGQAEPGPTRPQMPSPAPAAP